MRLFLEQDETPIGGDIRLGHGPFAAGPGDLQVDRFDIAEAKVGDRVRVMESRPLSKLKRWRLVDVVEKKAEVAPVAA